MQGALLNEPTNEPVLSYAPGSDERAELRAEVQRQSGEPREVALQIGAERRMTRERRQFSAPHRHALKLGEHAIANASDVADAIGAAQAAKSSWSALAFEKRAEIFLR